MNNNKRTGTFISIQDSFVNARFHDDVIMGETAEMEVDGKLLQAEVLQIDPDLKNAGAGIAQMQVFEDLAGAQIGDKVEFPRKPLSALLGPKLLTSIWDGRNSCCLKVFLLHQYRFIFKKQLSVLQGIRMSL